jgi:hypothetical protein
MPQHNESWDYNDPKGIEYFETPFFNIFPFSGSLLLVLTSPDAEMGAGAWAGAPKSQNFECTVWHQYLVQSGYKVSVK